MANYHIGTSGWNYSGWRGSFYPDDLSSTKWLAFYARRFRTTEVNYSFYQLPRVTTYEKWCAQTPDDFIFALKLSRSITHIKRLSGFEAMWNEFVTRARALGPHLGPILVQLPSSFHASSENMERVEHFLDYASSARLRLAFEFRDKSCFAQKMLSILRKHGASLVISHSSRYPVPVLIATARFVYFRFHGPREMFASSYSDAELRTWSKAMRSVLESGKDVYAYFNNDACGDAVPNALKLISLIKKST